MWIKRPVRCQFPKGEKPNLGLLLKVLAVLRYLPTFKMAPGSTLPLKAPCVAMDVASEGPERTISDTTVQDQSVMSSETIKVVKRTEVGSNASKRLRATGQVPAILYGHGEENINLSVRADAIQNVVKHGTKLLSLTGDISDTAILREVQWDAFSVDILHVDLYRVSVGEAVEVTLPVHLRGEAPGVSEGGQMGFITHELTINCPAANIPEFIEVDISKLHLGQAIHANEVKLPEGASMVTVGGQVVVQVARPSHSADETELTPATEPELIRKEKPKAEDE